MPNKTMKVKNALFEKKYEDGIRIVIDDISIALYVKEHPDGRVGDWVSDVDRSDEFALNRCADDVHAAWIVQYRTTFKRQDFQAIAVLIQRHRFGAGVDEFQKYIHPAQRELTYLFEIIEKFQTQSPKVDG